MTTLIASRQPFAVLDASRLQALSSTKNRQNAMTKCSAPSKPTLLSSPSKRRLSAAAFDDYDAENIDPALSNSPSKRSKGADGTPKKASKFILTDTPKTTKQAPSLSARLPNTTSPISRKRTALSSASSTKTTPISTSRGSPKHKRIGLLSGRRSSSSPLKRIDSPFGNKARQGGPSLPFSLDAALSGTISGYTPKSEIAPVEKHAPSLEESMPKSWFFEIYEDTPEEEAANLMEHSTYTLDISSDDDGETKRANEERERGKENIPPPDHFLAAAAASTLSEHASSSVKGKGRKPLSVDAMVEDRSPLGDLPASDYYGPGLDATSFAIIDGNAPGKPSGLSKEYKTEFEDAETDVESEAEELAVVDEKVIEAEKDLEAREEFVVYEDPATPEA